MLSGAAGLRIGHALLAPGRLTRRAVAGAGDARVRGPAVRRHRDAARRRRRSRPSGRRRSWLPPAVKYSVAARVLDRRARLLRLPGPPCRLTRSPCGCGRGRRRKPPISACVSARARRASVYRCYVIVALPVLVARAGLVRDRRLAAGAGDLVGEAVARSHDPVRPVARRVRAATTSRRSCGARSGRCGGASCCSRGRCGACRRGGRSRSRSTSSKGCRSASARRARSPDPAPERGIRAS